MNFCTKSQGILPVWLQQQPPLRCFLPMFWRSKGWCWFTPGLNQPKWAGQGQKAETGGKTETWTCVVMEASPDCVSKQTKEGDMQACVETIFPCEHTCENSSMTCVCDSPRGFCTGVSDHYLHWCKQSFSLVVQTWGRSDSQPLISL